MKKADMVTKKDYFNELIGMFSTMDASAEFFKKGDTVITYGDTTSFLENEIELIEKKAASKSNKPTKTQEENEKLKTVILEVLSNGNYKTIKEMTTADTALNGLSSSKMSALLTQLRKDNLIIREYDKKTPIYKIVVE